MLSTGENLHRRIYGTPPRSRSRRRLALPPAAMPGMGVLEWLEVKRPSGRTERWEFRSPKPRLCYERDVPAAEGRTVPCWIVGGSYRVDRGGFRNLGGNGGLERLSAPALRDRYGRVLKSFERTHGGLKPTEALRGRVTISDELIAVGLLEAITYSTDKNDDGRAPYRHPFEFPPTVCVTDDGRQLVLVGGSYTTTPHGIEDVEP